MKEAKIPVTRVLTTPDGSDIERKTVVTFRNAESVNEMLALAANDLTKVLSLYNNGRWAELRTKVSNALANKTPQQRAADKLIESYKTIMPGLDEATIKQMVMSMPGMQDAMNTAMESIPAETDEAYFDRKKGSDDAAEENGEEKAEAPASA